MKNLLFNYNYDKLHNQTSAELVYFRIIKIDKDTPKELIEYDTAGGCYDFDFCEYYQLFFIGNLGIPFCTLRKVKDSNKHFENEIGSKFDIIITH